jgi:hypothetical protein
MDQGALIELLSPKIAPVTVTVTVTPSPEDVNIMT